MDNVKNNLSKLLHDKAVTANRVITPHEISQIIQVRDVTIKSWLDNKLTRLDWRVLKALCKYFDVPRVVLDIQNDEIIFERNNSE
jgi:hypothetical protein